MTGVSTWVAIIGGLLGVLALVSAAWAVIRSGYTSARADDAEKRIAALRGEIADKDRRESDLLQSVQELTHRVEVVERENATLRELVPTSDQLSQLRELQQRHFNEATAYIDEWRVTNRSTKRITDQVLALLHDILGTLRGGRNAP